MKILFLTDNFTPEINAPANRTYEHCMEWVKLGEKVTVITGFPNFPQGKVYDGYKNKLIKVEYIDGIKVIRVWTFITANEGFVKRTLDFISFSITSFLVGLFCETDVIIATSPQFFTALSGRWLSFFKRKPWIFEVRDLWPESIVAVGAMRRNNIIKFFEFLELRLYKNANKIIVVTDSFKQKIIEKGINSTKIFVHKNGANLSLFKTIEKDEKLIDELKLRGKKVIAYVGTHGMAHGLDFILNAVKKIESTHPNIHFLFMGDGAEKNNLINLKDSLQLTNVTMLPSVSKKEVVKYLSLMDFALVNLRKSDTFLNVIPSKIFEAAAMQKPILLGLEGETKQLIQEYNAGLCFEPENESDFLDKIEKIIDENNKNNLKLGCHNLAKDFDRNLIANKMLFDIKK
jgi:glycosyltransferase involved in cell wall biosynthesis